MTTRSFNWRSPLCIVHCALCIIVLGLCMSVTSCKDDDNDNKSEEQMEQEALQKADAFWDIVGQLTSTDNYTADYRDKTFEPTIGEPLEGNNTVRVVATNDMASAAARFASLVGVSIDPSTSSYTYTNDAVGKLTYTKSDNGKSWATVDVNIKQMPNLQQIIYRSPEQGGTNASKMGTCYYRFGDVVTKTYTDKEDNNKQKTEYWVCVRPAFNPEGKGDSHWITVSPLPKKHIWTYQDSKKRDWALPTGIGRNEEHMQNLAEMLYAIINPDQWEKNVKDNPAPGIFSSGLRMFHDFSHDEDMVKYHSAKFWNRVKQAWEDKEICTSLFGMDLTALTKIIDTAQRPSGGLYLLVKGYSWWTSTSWNLSLYQYKYENGLGNESNMHKVTGMTEIKNNVENLDEPINVNTEFNYLIKMPFFGSAENRFIIRHATGKELAGFQPNKYMTLHTENNGITDIYTYNDYYYNKDNVSDHIAPETSDDILDSKAGHNLIDLGLKFNDNEFADSIFPTNPATTINLGYAWEQNATKKDFTLYAFAFPKEGGDKQKLGEYSITTDANNAISINFKDLKQGEYVLCLTKNQDGKDPCAYVKGFKMEKPEFTLLWENVPEEVFISTETGEGTLKATLTNLNSVKFDKLYVVYKNLTNPETQSLGTYDNYEFKKGETKSFKVRYLVNRPDNYAWILSTDEKGEEVVIQRTIKGKANNKKPDNVTKNDLYSIVGNDGLIYPTTMDCLLAKATPVAMIVVVPWESEEKNQKVEFSTYSNYFDREEDRDPKTADLSVGLKHAMAIPINSNGVVIEECTLSQAESLIKEWNLQGHHYYVKGNLNWRLPSVYLIMRMMNDNMTGNHQPNDSPNLATWKGKQLLDPKTVDNATRQNFGKMPPFGYASNLLYNICPNLHLPETFWMIEYMTFNSGSYNLAMHHDENYPSGDRELMYYYFPLLYTEKAGFMPILVW